MKKPSQQIPHNNSLNQPSNKPWNYQQLAEFLGMSPASLRVWVMQGKLPYYKIGKLVRFDQTLIQEWLDSYSVKVGGEK